ncbi:SDR family oxidoreductase [Pedobacter psychrodurus]|uniref:SDR family oxidoreductase n=1 Tax=Pedobacter psychrodurus TaxID=2530456 RepID=UPI00292D8E45|nr:SDR family oxidoreductase [Pedobacter psychrodurus]
MKNEIKGKVVVITGASSGIGRAIAKELGRAGAKIVLGARRKKQLSNLSEEINNQGGESSYIETDVINRTALVALVNKAVDNYGTLDVIINNAGVGQLSRIDALDVEGWEEMIDINLKGVLYGMAAAIPVFKRQNSGHIINIISTSGIKIVPEQGVYAATKNAVRTIAEAFRQESDGTIRITGISPGVVKTDLANGMKNEAMKNAIIENMEKMAISPQAIADAVIYAMSQPLDVEVGDMVIRPSAQR